MRRKRGTSLAWAFVLPACIAVHAGEMPVMRPGDTLHGVVTTPGDPLQGSASFELETIEGGPVTIEARSLDLDTALKVFRLGPDGALTPLGEDNDGGIATNSRLEIAALPGERYRIDLRAGEGARGGEFEISVTPGKTAALDPKTETELDLAYWRQVVSRGIDKGSVDLEAKGLMGQAGILRARGSYAEARPLYERALVLREKALGSEHAVTAATINDLGMLLHSMGEHAAARPHYERALAIREKLHGPEHPATGQSLHNLGLLLQAMGEYASARPVLERALAINEKALGSEHAHVATALTSLAGLLRVMGEYAAARPLLERALTIREKVRGAEHPETALSLDGLAAVLDAVGERAAARGLYERALAIREKAFGAAHPQTAASLNILADHLAFTGEYAAARPLYERALAIREKALGPEHPQTATSLNNLASLLQDVGEYRASRSLYERAVAIWEKTLGPDHRDTARGLNNLASLLQDTGEYAAALPVLERALAIQEKSLGPEHPSTAGGFNNLAVVLRAMGEYARARPLYERALAILEKAHGPEHPSTAVGLNNLGGLLQAMGEHEAAEALFERAVAITGKALGPDHPHLAASLGNLGRLLHATGDHVRARALYERALSIQEGSHGREHPDTAADLNDLAALLQDMGERTAARPLYERALGIFEKALGPEHPDTARGLSNTATLLQDLGEPAAARPLFERALAIREKALGPAHPDVAGSLEHLGRVLAAQGERAAALDRALEAERIGREHLKVTSRSLSEREALRYAAIRQSGLDLALTLAASGIEPGARRRVLDAVVRSRALVLDEMAARHKGIGGSADPEVARLAEHLASRRERLASVVVRGPGDRKPELYRKLLDEARKEKEEAERALAASSAEFARELSRGQLGLDEVATSLPEGSALVAFTQYQNVDFGPKARPAHLAFVLRAGARDPEVVDLGPEKEIDAAVSRWKQEASRGLMLEGDAAQAEAEVGYREAGATLRRKVWDPLAAAIGDAGRVFIVPDGSLNLINLAALPLEAGGYLIERGPLVHYVSAERDLVAAGEARQGEGLLALGGPSYDATEMFAGLRKGQAPGTSPAQQPALSGAPLLLASAATYRGQRSACGDFASVRFEPLPATAKETREVERLWEMHGSPTGTNADRSVIDLREAAASETALKREAAGRRVLHLATHGFFLGRECESALASTRGIGGLAEQKLGVAPAIQGENPLLLAGLALAGANHRSAAHEGEDDGILTAEEIASLDLSGVEWAVLSACETGVGDVRVGEGVFGLRRAFQVAGAGTVIMSLWSVDDESTREWMKALYEGRLEKKLDTAEAVRRASLTVLERRRDDGESTHPFYWAAFVAAGDWR